MHDQASIGERSRPVAGEVVATVILALPLIAGQLAGMGQGVIDVLLAGHLSAHVLGAVAVGTSVWGLAYMSASGTMMALPPEVARLDGAGRRHEIAALFRQALYLAAVLGIVLGVLLFALGPVLVQALGFGPELSADAGGFLRAIAFAAPALTLFFACRGLMDGLGIPRPGMVFALLALLVLAPVGYVLMYGKLGLPSLGARGSGLAAAITLWSEVIGFAAWLRWTWRSRRLGVMSQAAPNFAIIGRLLRVGSPMGASALLESGLFTFATLAIARFGEAAAGGHQIALNVSAFAFMVPLGLSTAVTVRVGNAVGRGDPAGIRRAGLIGMGLAMLLELLSCTAMLTVPGGIAGLYTSVPAVVAAATPLVVLAGVFQLSDGLQVAAFGALRGLQDTRVPMLICVVAYWAVGMPVGVTLAFGLGFGPVGMWMGLIAGLGVAAVLLSWRFLQQTRVTARKRVLL